MSNVANLLDLNSFNINNCDLKSLIKKHYGLQIKVSKELNSYDDKNYYVEFETEEDNSHIHLDGYVVKILNADDSKNSELVEAQNSILEFLKSKDFEVPTPIKNKNGQYLTYELFPLTEDSTNVNRKKHIIRILKFVPGKLIVQTNITKEMLYELGILIGKLYNALKGVRNCKIEKREYLWMLTSVSNLDQYFISLDENWKLELVQKVLQDWKSIVVPVIPTLEKGIIHGDLNEQNVLIEEDDLSSYHIKGVIDFGDVSYSCYIFDLAVSITYMLMFAADIDFNLIPGYVVAGYLTQRTLTETEWSILKSTEMNSNHGKGNFEHVN